MTPRAWAHAFRDAFRSMTQSMVMSLASVATVAVSLLVLAVVLLLAVNLEYMAATVEQQVEIKAYLCSGNDEEAVCTDNVLDEPAKQQLVAKVQQLPGVRQVTYVTRDEALQEMKEQFGEQASVIAILEGENPLRDEIRVQATEAIYVEGIAEAMAAEPGIAKVEYGKEYVDKLLTLTHAVRIGGVGLVLMLVIATVLTISNTIRLAVYARRREISIMKLVGATDWYIRRPFVLEGIFLGVFGSLLAMALTGTGYQRFVRYVYENIPFLPVIPPEDVLMNLTVSLMLLGGVLGAVGSMVSMRRFLKV